LFDHFSSLGLVLSVQPDTLKVLLSSNRVSHVKLTQISKKINVETRGLTGKRMTNRSAVVTDKFHNTISMRTIVKPTETGPFKDCLG